MQVFFIPNDGIPLPVQKALSLDPQTPAAFGQYLYIRTNSGQCVQVENTPEGDAMMKLLVPEGVADSHTPVIEQTLFQLMIGSCSPEKAEQILDHSLIPDPCSRYLLVLDAENEPGSSFIEDIRQIAQTEGSSDYVFMIAPGQAALMKSSDMIEDEIIEYAAAVADSLTGEVGIDAKVGISKVFEHLHELPAAYQQAVSAVRISKLFHMDGSVFSYKNLIMERLLDAVPESKVQSFMQEVMTPAVYRTMEDEELMSIIQSCLRNDLNLSTTARDLYIHRNTLVYRLDKLKKETGFDIRHFDDAVMFRILTSLYQKDQNSDNDSERKLL